MSEPTPLFAEEVLLVPAERDRSVEDGRRSGLVFRRSRSPSGEHGSHSAVAAILEFEAWSMEAETERDLAVSLVRVLGSFFQGHEVLLRLRTAEDRELLVATSAPSLAPKEMAISHAAAVRHDLLSKPLSFSVMPAYAPVFWENSIGIDVPLLDGADILGAVYVECPPGSVPVERDILSAVVVVSVFSASLRAVRESAERRALTQRLLGLGAELDALRSFVHIAAGAAHEINNPLTAIEIEADYLVHKASTDSLGGEDRERLVRIGRDARRIEHLARDIVIHARPSTEAARPHLLGEVLDEAVAFCGHVISAAGVRVDKRYAGCTAAVIGARRQLHQIFINVITNACQAMAGRGGALVIDARSEGGAAIASIRDQGPGIAQGDLERIFDPFFTTKTAQNGTGLGLAIVRRLVREHGGDVRVYSSQGQGTTFDIALPSPVR